MYKIYIDTSERYKKSVKLVRAVSTGFDKGDGFENFDEKYTVTKEQELGSQLGDIDIVVSIKELLREHNLKPKDIEEVIPNLGPGSFTGLKMGVTVANIINWLNGKKELDELDLPEYGAEPNIQT